MDSVYTYDVFISAKSEDNSLAEDVYLFLVEHGLKVFWSKKELPLIGRSGYSLFIDKAIDGSHHMVVVASSLKNIESSFVMYEWSTFSDDIKSGYRNGNLLTILDDSIQLRTLPPSLRHQQSFPLSKYKETLLDYLRKDTADSPQPAAETESVEKAPRTTAPPRINHEDNKGESPSSSDGLERDRIIRDDINQLEALLHKLQGAEKKGSTERKKELRIGDFYKNGNGASGIIFKLDETKQHGILLSTAELESKWSGIRPVIRTGLTDYFHGYANMSGFLATLKGRFGPFDFPAFFWCDNYRPPGWALPAVEELKALSSNLKIVNQTLEKMGLKKVDEFGCYWSSTESTDYFSAYYVYMADGKVGNTSKSSDRKVRAITYF